MDCVWGKKLTIGKLSTHRMMLLVCWGFDAACMQDALALNERQLTQNINVWTEFYCSVNKAPVLIYILMDFLTFCVCHLFWYLNQQVDCAGCFMFFCLVVMYQYSIVILLLHCLFSSHRFQFSSFFTFYMCGNEYIKENWHDYKLKIAKWNLAPFLKP